MPPSKSEITRMHAAIRQGLSIRIPTFEILRRYERHYDRLSPSLNEEQRFHLMSQFARHENFLAERNNLPLRPSPQQIKRQAGETLNRAHSAPISTEDVDPFNIGPPSVAGNIRQAKRKRSKSEEDLMALESLDDFNWDEPPSPPPPPPPSEGGVGGPISI